MKSRDIFSILLFIGIVSGIPGYGGACLVGTCSLDPGDMDQDDRPCPIPADTFCNAADSRYFCKGRGTCVFLRDQPKPHCVCADPWYGENCGYKFNASIGYCISERNCGLTRGKCIPRWTGGTGTCQCNTGFKGIHCESLALVFLTHDTSCVNGGVRYQLGNELGCFCPCGFYGPTCNLVDQAVFNQTGCDGYICNGNGYCKVDDNGVGFCECKGDLQGQFCEYMNVNVLPAYSTATTPAYSTRPAAVSPVINCPDYDRPCVNGGNCIVYNGTKHCICKCGHFGPTCQYSTDKTSIFYKDWCEAVDYVCPVGQECYVNPGTCNLDCRYIRRTSHLLYTPAVAENPPWNKDRNSKKINIWYIYPILLPCIIIMILFVVVGMFKTNRKNCALNTRRTCSAIRNALASSTQQASQRNLSSNTHHRHIQADSYALAPNTHRTGFLPLSSSSTRHEYASCENNLSAQRNVLGMTNINAGPSSSIGNLIQNSRDTSCLGSVWSTSLNPTQLSTNTSAAVSPQTGTVALPQYTDSPPSYEDAVDKPPSYIDALRT